MSLNDRIRAAQIRAAEQVVIDDLRARGLSDTPIFARDQFAKPGDDAGIFIDALGTCLVTWAAMQNRPVTVHDAATAFNTTPEIIAEACEDAPWIYVVDDRLELDGA